MNGLNNSNNYEEMLNSLINGSLLDTTIINKAFSTYYYVKGKDNNLISFNDYKNKIGNSGQFKNSEIVKVTVSEDAKIYHSDHKLSEKEIESLKKQDYDIVSISTEEGTEYVVLNDDIIENEKKLSFKQANDDYDNLTKEYNETNEKIIQLFTSFLSGKGTEKTTNYSGASGVHFSEEAKQKLTEQLQKLNLIGQDETVSDSTYESYYNTYSSIANDQNGIKIDGGYLLRSIEKLSDAIDDFTSISVDLNDFSIDDEISSIKLCISELNVVKDTVNKLIYKNDNNVLSGSLTSYKSRLNNLKEMLANFDANWEISADAQYLYNIQQFGEEENLTDIEMLNLAEKVRDNTKSTISRKEISRKHIEDTWNTPTHIHNKIVVPNLYLYPEDDELYNLLDFANQLTNAYTTSVFGRVAQDKWINEKELTIEEEELYNRNEAKNKNTVYYLKDIKTCMLHGEIDEGKEISEANKLFLKDYEPTFMIHYQENHNNVIDRFEESIVGAAQYVDENGNKYYLVKQPLTDEEREARIAAQKLETRRGGKPFLVDESIVSDYIPEYKYVKAYNPYSLATDEEMWIIGTGAKIGKEIEDQEKEKLLTARDNAYDALDMEYNYSTFDDTRFSIWTDEFIIKGSNDNGKGNNGHYQFDITTSSSEITKARFNVQSKIDNATGNIEYYDKYYRDENGNIDPNVIYDYNTYQYQITDGNEELSNIDMLEDIFSPYGSYATKIYEHEQRSYDYAMISYNCSFAQVMKISSLKRTDEQNDFIKTYYPQFLLSYENHKLSRQLELSTWDKTIQGNNLDSSYTSSLIKHVANYTSSLKNLEGNKNYAYENMDGTKVYVPVDYDYLKFTQLITDTNALAEKIENNNLDSVLLIQSLHDFDEKCKPRVCSVKISIDGGTRIIECYDSDGNKINDATKEEVALYYYLNPDEKLPKKSYIYDYMRSEGPNGYVTIPLYDYGFYLNGENIYNFVKDGAQSYKTGDINAQRRAQYVSLKNSDNRISSVSYKKGTMGMPAIECYDASGNIISNVTADEISLYYYLNSNEKLPQKIGGAGVIFLNGKNIYDSVKDGMLLLEYGDKDATFNEKYLDLTGQLANIVLYKSNKSVDIANQFKTKYGSTELLIGDIAKVLQSGNITDLKEFTNARDGVLSAQTDLSSTFSFTTDYFKREEGKRIASTWLNNSNNAVDDVMRSLWHGVKQFGRGIVNLFGDADGYLSAEDYALSYYSLGLVSKYGSYGELVQGICEFATSLGNMGIPWLISIAGHFLTAVCPPLGIALSYAGTALMGISAAGNAREQGLQMGMTEQGALAYGILIGSCEVLFEKFLGGIDNVSTKLFSNTLAGALGISAKLADLLSEGIEEACQEMLEPIIAGWFTGKGVFGGAKDIDFNNVIKAGLQGIAMAGVLNGASSGITNGISQMTTGTSFGLDYIISQRALGNMSYEQVKSTMSEMRTLSKVDPGLTSTKTNIAKDATFQQSYNDYIEQRSQYKSKLESEYEALKSDKSSEGKAARKAIQEQIESLESNSDVTMEQFIEQMMMESITSKLNAAETVKGNLDSASEVLNANKINSFNGDIVQIANYLTQQMANNFKIQSENVGKTKLENEADVNKETKLEEQKSKINDIINNLFAKLGISSQENSSEEISTKTLRKVLNELGVNAKYSLEEFRSDPSDIYIGNKSVDKFIFNISGKFDSTGRYTYTFEKGKLFSYLVDTDYFFEHFPLQKLILSDGSFNDLLTKQQQENIDKILLRKISSKLNYEELTMFLESSDFLNTNDFEKKIIFTNLLNNNLLSKANVETVGKIFNLLCDTKNPTLKTISNDIITKIFNKNADTEYFERVSNVLENSDIIFGEDTPLFYKIFKLYEVCFNKEYGRPNRFSEEYIKENNLSDADEYDIANVVFYNNLVRICLKSNNLEFRTYLNNIINGSNLFMNAIANNSDISNYSTSDINELNSFISKLVALGKLNISGFAELNNYDFSKMNNLEKLNVIKNTINYDSSKLLQDSIVSALLKSFGITSMEEVITFMDSNVSTANDRNIKFAKENPTLKLENGDFVRGVGNNIINMLNEGNYCNEFAILFTNRVVSDTTPFDIDFRPVTNASDTSLNNQLSNYGKLPIDDYGIKILLKKGHIQEIIGNEVNVDDPNSLRIYAQQGYGKHQYGILTGISMSEVDAIIYTPKVEFDVDFKDPEYDRKYQEFLNKLDNGELYDYKDLTDIKRAVVQNGYYIPIYDCKGNLIFTVEEYNKLSKTKQIAESYIDSLKKGIKGNDWNLSLYPEALTYKIDGNQTIIEYILNNNIEISYWVYEAILKNAECMRELIKRDNYDFVKKIWNSESSELLFEKYDSDNLIIDKLFEAGKIDRGIIRIIINPEIINVCERLGKLELIEKYASEEILFTKMKDGKLYIESLFENDKMSDSNGKFIVSGICKHPEIFDLCMKYGRHDLISQIRDEMITQTSENGKTYLEIAIDNGIISSKWSSKECLDIYIKLARIDLFKFAGYELLLTKINDTQTYLDLLIEFTKKNMGTKNIILDNSYFYDTDYYAQALLKYAENDILELISKPTKSDLLMKKKDGKRLIDSLLELNKDLTVNKILSSKLKSDIEIASILKSYGINQKIEVANSNSGTVDNIVSNFLNGMYSYIDEIKLDAESEQILSNFREVMNDGESDMELIDAYVRSYRRSISLNPNFKYELQKLIEIKKSNSDFSIKTNSSGSFYSHALKYVALENGSLETLNHETGHALHNLLANGDIPAGFEQLINKIGKDPNFIKKVKEYSDKYYQIISEIIDLVDGKFMPIYDADVKNTPEDTIIKMLLEERESVRQECLKKGYNESLIDEILNENYTDEEFVKQARENVRLAMFDIVFRTQYGNFFEICDYLDGITGGFLHDQKLVDAQGNYIRRTGGHGIYYYNREGDYNKVFAEMVANYSAIIKSENPTEGLNNLREYVGDELVDMIAEFYENRIFNYNNSSNNQNTNTSNDDISEILIFDY